MSKYLKMIQVSSNLTLFFKIFLPTFWIVFFGAFTIAVWATEYEYFGSIPASTLRIGSLIFYLVGSIFLFLTVIRLKRVEMGETMVYVTNYFKHYQYPISNVKRLIERDFLLFRTVKIKWEKPGSFGKSTVFLLSKSRFNHYLEMHPKVKLLLLQPGEEEA